MTSVVASLKVSQPSLRSKLRKFSCAIPFQTALKHLKIGISGALDGPQHNVNTFDEMSSMIWLMAKKPQKLSTKFQLK